MILSALLGEKDVWLYPVNELIGSEIGVASPELKAQRIEVLNRLTDEAMESLLCQLQG